MNSFNNKSIKFKLISTFVTMIIVFAGLFTLMQFGMGDVGYAYDETYQVYGRGQGYAASIEAQFYRAIAEVEYCFLSHSAEDLATRTTATKEALQDMETEMDELGTLVSGTEIEDSFIEAEDTINKFIQCGTTMVGYIEKGDMDGAKLYLASDELSDYRTGTTVVIQKLLDEFVTQGDIHIGQAELKQAMTKYVFLGITIVFGLLILFWALNIVKNLRRPIEELEAAAKKLATGDIDVVVRKHFDDDIGVVADAFNKMIENTKYQAGIVKEASSGNLDIEVNPASDRDITGNALKVLVTENNNVLLNIRDAVGEVTAGSEEIASASQSLAQGSTEQASAIQQITASIDEITQKIRVNASDATEAKNLVSQAKDDAVIGNDRMTEMIGAMNDINLSSENISKIIKVIDDIAFQTNILALNAAVEAARAGQHGKGFAVVAEEVRNLAGKSAQAASETAELIEDSIGKVGRGSKLAEETASSLSGIVSMIEKIVELTASIATASSDQATAIAQIDQALGQVSQVVQTNSATSEECAAASEQLSSQSEKLRDMVAKYRLKEYRHNSDAVKYSYTPKEDYRVDISHNNEYGDKEPVISLEDGFGKY